MRRAQINQLHIILLPFNTIFKLNYLNLITTDFGFQNMNKYDS
jgi:hypothetical protein